MPWSDRLETAINSLPEPLQSLHHLTFPGPGDPPALSAREIAAKWDMTMDEVVDLLVEMSAAMEAALDDTTNDST